MKTILRVEYADGAGMFTNRYKDNYRTHTVWDIGLAIIGNRHGKFNTPQEDGLNIKKDGKEWFCAYKSIEQFQDWVKPKEAKKLTQNGYNILLLEVEDYQEGRDQVIFTKESIVSSKEINSLF